MNTVARIAKRVEAEQPLSAPEIREKFLRIIEKINTRVIGMPEVVRGVALAILANDTQYGEHVFMIGPPGVGKSYVMNVWASCIDMPTRALFDYLLHQFSVPEEMGGPTDIDALLPSGMPGWLATVGNAVVDLLKKMRVAPQDFNFPAESAPKRELRRAVEGFLPTAHFAVLDEIWKAGSVTTMLLQILNERKFMNGSTMLQCPLITALSASNEYPSNKMDMPLWDRLLFRFKVEAVWDPEGIKAIQASKRVPWNVERVTLPEIYVAKQAVWGVEIPPDVEEAMISIHVALLQAGIELSGRRRDKMYAVVRANAWLNGKDVATVDDVAAIWPCCWEHDTQIKQVRKIIAKISNFELDKLMTQLDVSAALHTDAQKIIEAYKASGGNSSLLGNIDEIEEKLGTTISELKDKRARLDPATQVEADVVISKITAWHRETVPYAMKKLETV